MSDQPASLQGSASAQLKQLLKERVSLLVGVTGKAAGQQAGTLAQAVRQAGEDFRQEGQEEQGKVADRVAAPVQRLSSSLSSVDAEDLSGGVKQVKPKLSELKTQTADQIKQQAARQAASAGQGITTLGQGVRQTGEQLRAQGQDVTALVLDAVGEKVDPIAQYLTTADPDRLLSDASAYGGKVKAKVTGAAGAANRKRQSATTTATAKGGSALRAAASGVRRSPMLPIAGLLVGAAIAGRRSSSPSPAPEVDAAPPAEVDAEEVEIVVEPAASDDLADLSRAQLQARAEAAGLAVDSDMSKKQLIKALRAA